MAILGILMMLVSLASLVLWIMVLVKTFQDKEKNGILHGVLGIISCSLWSFIWGWMNATRLGIKKLMVYWTATAVIYLVLIGVSMAMQGPAIMSQMDQMQQMQQNMPMDDMSDSVGQQ